MSKSQPNKKLPTAPYPCQSLPLFSPGVQLADCTMGYMDRSIFGFNQEYTIKNTTIFTIHVYSANGEKITVLPPHIPTISKDQPITYISNAGIQVYYRKCEGSQITKGKKPADPQEYMTRTYFIDELTTAPIYIPELQIILALEDHTSSITTYSESLELILNGNARDEKGVIKPLPFCAYVNLNGVDNRPEYLYLTVNKTVFLRVPVIQVDYLSPGTIMSKFEIVAPDDTVSTHGLSTTYDELHSEEGGGVAFCHCTTGDIFHFSFDLTLLRVYLSDNGNLTEEETTVAEKNLKAATLSEEDCERRVHAATTTLRTENEILKSELDRITKDRDRLVKEKADIEKLADRAFSPGSYEKKKEDQHQDQKDKRIKTKLSHVLDVLKILGVIGGICAALKDPFIWFFKTVSPWFKKTPSSQPS